MEGSPAHDLAMGLIAYLDEFAEKQGTLLEAIDPCDYKSKCVGEGPVQFASLAKQSGLLSVILKHFPSAL
eukprot:15095419-Alexandrium_andersonii.AAC.1